MKNYSRKNRVRSKILRLKNRPRLTVFRSNRFIYAQIIDNLSGNVVCAFGSKKLTSVEKKLGKIDQAEEVGKKIAGLAVKAKIKEVVFDRGNYRYHGRVKALADGAREGGLVF